MKIHLNDICLYKEIEVTKNLEIEFERHNSYMSITVSVKKDVKFKIYIDFECCEKDIRRANYMLKDYNVELI